MNKINNMKTTIFALALFLGTAAMAFAVTDTATHDVTMQINEIALIDLNDGTAITLTTNPPASGGDLVQGDTDSTKLLQYTSLVGAVGTRNITVEWGGADAAPAGTSLSVEATSVTAGCGTVVGGGTAISAVAASIVTGIGSCATGTGANGAALTYTFAITDVNSLVVGDNQTVTITFTLTDAV